ncbi:MAG: LysR substrate-binding domain-containing protein, partial [Dermatophilaceae bacterium]
LARLERRVGERLFDRDTTGARATPAGAEMVAQAEHMLGHLAEMFDRTRAAARHRTLHVGTLNSLASLLFPPLDELLPDVVVAQRVDHGPRLVGWVAEGSLDAAVIAMAEQMTLPRSVGAIPIGDDRYAAFVPEAVRRPVSGRRPYLGREVVAYTCDLSGDVVVRRLDDLGATARLTATSGTAVATARTRRCIAVLPRSLAILHARAAEHVVPAPMTGGVTLYLVSRRPAAEELVSAMPGLRERIGLRRPRAGSTR